MIDETKWKEKAKEIDDKIHSKIKSWLYYLPTPLDNFPLFGKFQEHLMYVIMSFLQKENTTIGPQELFIQIPIEEFANKRGNDKLQINSFQKVTGTIAACLQLITINKTINTIFINNNSIVDGLYYYAEQDCRPYLRHLVVCKRKDYLYIKNVCLTDRSGNKYEDRIFRRNRISGDKINELKIIAQIKENKRFDAYEIWRQISHIRKFQDSIDVRQYNSAVLVRIGNYPPLNEKILLESNYFPTIDQVNDISKIQRDSNTEVIVVFGSKRYMNDGVQAFRRRAFKKIIYIGSELPCEGIDTYPFTYREMYRYCAPQFSGIKYNEPTLVTGIKFDWLDNTINDFESFLDGISDKDSALTDDIKQQMCKVLRSAFSSIDFCNAKWKDKKDKIASLLLNLIDEEEEIYEDIRQWIEKLDYQDDSNPKKDWLTNKKTQLVLGRFDSYKREVNKLSDYENHIVLDSATYNKNGSDVAMNHACSYIFSHCLFAKITSLYYRGEQNYANRLLWYLNKEYECYGCDTRKELGTNYDYLDNTLESIDFSLENIRLDDYDDGNIRNAWTSTNEVVMVTMTDGNVYEVDGDVLLYISEQDDYARMSISELKNENFSRNSTTIWFYQTPSNFDEMITAYLNLPTERNLDYYSNLWKTMLRDYYNSKIDEGIPEKDITKELEKQLRIKKSVFKKYLDDKCTNQYMKTMRNMKYVCEFLAERHLITQDESDNVRKAQKLYFKRTQFGKTLKDEILSAKEDNTMHFNMIPVLMDKLQLSKDQLINSCLKSGTISKIKIRKKS